MEKHTRAVVYYRYARKGHADQEREVADYFAARPAVSVVAAYRETNAAARPMLREAIEAARKESAAILVAGEYRQDRTYEVICSTLGHEGIPFTWLGSLWSDSFFPEGARPPMQRATLGSPNPRQKRRKTSAC